VDGKEITMRKVNFNEELLGATGNTKYKVFYTAEVGMFPYAVGPASSQAPKYQVNSHGVDGLGVRRIRNRKAEVMIPEVDGSVMKQLLKMQDQIDRLEKLILKNLEDHARPEIIKSPVTELFDSEGHPHHGDNEEGYPHHG
jgi:hypothetical protein